jgi:hypothetical protein
MKATAFITRTKIVFFTLASALMIFSISSGAAQVNFLNSSVVPAARGTVSVKKDSYNNYIMEIQVENLAEAGRLSPPKSTYVVWMVTDQNFTKNIGQVKTSKKFLSKQLKASFETKSSFKPVKIFITAEYDPNLQSTNSDVVLTTEYFDLPKQ